MTVSQICSNFGKAVGVSKKKKNHTEDNNLGDHFIMLATSHGTLTDKVINKTSREPYVIIPQPTQTQQTLPIAKEQKYD